jgi:hypothetical protein
MSEMTTLHPTINHVLNELKRRKETRSESVEEVFGRTPRMRLSCFGVSGHLGSSRRRAVHSAAAPRAPNETAT